MNKPIISPKQGCERVAGFPCLATVHYLFALLLALAVLAACTAADKKATEPKKDFTELLNRYKLLDAEFSLSDSGNWKALDFDPAAPAVPSANVIAPGLLARLNRSDSLFSYMKLAEDSLCFPLYRFPIDSNHWGLLTVAPYAMTGVDGHLFLSVFHTPTGAVSSARALSQSALMQSNAIGVWRLSFDKNKIFTAQEKIYLFDGYDCPPEKCPPKYKFDHNTQRLFAFEPDAEGKLNVITQAVVERKQ